MGWNYGDDKKKSASARTPAGKQLAEEEKSVSTAISTVASRSISLVASRSISFLTGPTYPEFPVKKDKSKSLLGDISDMDLVSLAGESGCSGQEMVKTYKTDSFDEYVRRHYA